MTDFNTNFGEARRAHLALVEGGASQNTSATSAATRTLGTDPVVRLAATTARTAATGYEGASSTDGVRSRHESGVRAVAKNYATFDDALLPMVLASGVSGEAAASVAEAIKSNPALKAQAERAFQRARLNAV